MAAVVREARAHFNCPDLEGADLEDQVGLDGVEQGTTLCTSSSHLLWLGRSGPTSTAQTWRGQSWKIRLVLDRDFGRRD
jgi:hypothetical protein